MLPSLVLTTIDRTLSLGELLTFLVALHDPARATSPFAAAPLGADTTVSVAPDVTPFTRKYCGKLKKVVRALQTIETCLCPVATQHRTQGSVPGEGNNANGAGKHDRPHVLHRTERKRRRVGRRDRPGASPKRGSGGYIEHSKLVTRAEEHL